MTEKEKLLEAMEKMYSLMHIEVPNILEEMSKEDKFSARGYAFVFMGFIQNFGLKEKCEETIKWVKNRE